VKVIMQQGVAERLRRDLTLEIKGPLRSAQESPDGPPVLTTETIRLFQKRLGTPTDT